MKAGEIKTEVRLGRTATEGKRGREEKRERTILWIQPGQSTTDLTAVLHKRCRMRSENSSCTRLT